MATVKDEAHRLIDSLPDECGWDDVVYQFYVRQRVEAGLHDIDAGRVISHEQLECEVETWFNSGGVSQPEVT
jgi:predicted transcriptional regulator